MTKSVKGGTAMHIIPKPNGPVWQQAGNFAPGGTLAVELGGFDPACLTAFARRTGIGCKTSATPKTLILVRDASLADEGYQLSVTPQGVSVAAATEQGVIWALTTLAQNIDARGEMPCVEMKDAPAFQHRGFHFDSCRHFFEKDEVLKVIEQAALCKINVLHWHLSDDQGWRIESKVFPQLQQVENQPYYTQDELREVVAFAASCGIDVIPELDMPGHTTSIIAAMPELSCTGQPIKLATTGGIFDDILCVGKDKTIDVVLKILDEVSALFPSRYFHVGGDEAPKKRWKACPDCNARLQALGLENFEQLQGWFMGRLQEHLREKSKTAIFWNDVLQGGGIAEDGIIQYWMPTADRGVTDWFNKGGRMVFSDMFHLYFDYPPSVMPLERAYRYTPRIGKRDCSADANTRGIECCLWTERIETVEHLERRLFPRLFALAEAAWTTEREYADFKKRLVPKLAALDAAGIAYATLEQSDPKGEERRRQTVDYIAQMQATAQPREKGEKMDVSMDKQSQRAMVKGFLKYFINFRDLPATLKQFRKGRAI